MSDIAFFLLTTEGEQEFIILHSHSKKKKAYTYIPLQIVDVSFTYYYKISNVG